MKIIADDGISLHVHDLSTLPGAWAELIHLEQHPQPVPRHPQLLSKRHIGHIQRAPEGYVVWSPTDSGVLYPRHHYGRAICSALDFTG